MSMLPSVAVQKSASLPPLVRDCGLLNQSHTRINKMLVSLRFRSSQKRGLHNGANFGIGTLGSRSQSWCRLPHPGLRTVGIDRDLGTFETGVACHTGDNGWGATCPTNPSSDNGQPRLPARPKPRRMQMRHAAWRVLPNIGAGLPTLRIGGGTVTRLERSPNRSLSKGRGRVSKQRFYSWFRRAKLKKCLVPRPHRI